MFLIKGNYTTFTSLLEIYSIPWWPGPQNVWWLAAHEILNQMVVLSVVLKILHWVIGWQFRLFVAMGKYLVGLTHGWFASNQWPVPSFACNPWFTTTCDCHAEQLGAMMPNWVNVGRILFTLSTKYSSDILLSSDGCLATGERTTEKHGCIQLHSIFHVLLSNL